MAFNIGEVLDNLFKNDDEDSLTLPEYYQNQDFLDTQEFLKNFGLSILQGDIPDYYSAIGETGSQEFKDMLGLSIKDIQQSTAESLAKQGRLRGGQLAASTADAIAETSISARYEDYLRSLEGKAGLLSLGTGITEGVRSAGLSEASLKNQFNLNLFNEQQEEREYSDLQDQEFGNFLGTLASLGLTAATGATGGTSFLSSLGKILTTSS